MHKKRTLSAILPGIISLLLFAGCQAKNSVGEPPVAMNSVTQNGQDDYINLKFSLPEGWITGTNSYFNVIACPEEALQKDFESEIEELPYAIQIGSYEYSEWGVSKEDKQTYTDLFTGNTEAYEARKNGFSAPSDDSKTPSSILDYFDMLAPKGDENSQSEDKPKNEFHYQHYDGTHGKITEVQYYSTYQGKTIHMIECYREDIPYMITGAFDDSVELSSGEIALWVADSLEVTEHFIVKDGEIQKED